MPVAAGVVAWTVVKRGRSLGNAWVAAPLAALGALPWLVWNAQHGWDSLRMPPYGDRTRSVRLLASPVLPMLTGLRAPFSAQLLLPKALTFLVYAGLIALFAYGALKARSRDASILYVVTVLFPFVYMLSPKTVFGAPRFVLVLAPVLALLLAQLATTFARAANGYRAHPVATFVVYARP